MNPSYQLAKEKGVLIKQEKGCEVYRLDDGPKHHFVLHSPKTGDHIVTQLDSQFEPRVSAHWKGFLSVQ